MRFKCACGADLSFNTSPDHRLGALYEEGAITYNPGPDPTDDWILSGPSRTWLWCHECGSLWIDSTEMGGEMVRFLPASRSDKPVHRAPDRPFKGV